MDEREAAIIIELKVAKEIEELKQKSEEALKQIEERKYQAYLKKIGCENIIKYGIAFCNKRCLIKMKRT